MKPDDHPTEPPRRPAPGTVDQEHEAGRRGHLALVDKESGKAGSPTPSERMEVYLAMLRRGKLPHGWAAARAKEWGLNRATVSEEIARARATLEASRAAPIAKGIAHELIMDAVELKEAARQLLSAPLAAKGDDAEMVTAKAKALEARVKALTAVAGLGLKCAAELRQLHGLKPAEGGGGLNPEDAVESFLREPVTKEALKGGQQQRGIAKFMRPPAGGESAPCGCPPWKKCDRCRPGSTPASPS